MPEYIDYKSPYATETIPKTGTAKQLIRLELKNGCRAFLLAVRNSVSAGGEDFILFSVRINGQPLEDFDRFKNQIAAPEAQNGQLVIRRELPQGALLDFIAVNTDAATDYSATVKLEIGYEAL